MMRTAVRSSTAKFALLYAAALFGAACTFSPAPAGPSDIDAEPLDAGIAPDALPAPDAMAFDAGPLTLPFPPSNVTIGQVPGSAGHIHITGACTLNVDAFAVSGSSTTCGSLLSLGYAQVM